MHGNWGIQLQLDSWQLIIFGLRHWVVGWLGSSVGRSVAGHLPGHGFESPPCDIIILFPLSFTSLILTIFFEIDLVRSDYQIWDTFKN